MFVNKYKNPIRLSASRILRVRFTLDVKTTFQKT